MIFLNSASSAAALVFYLPCVCTHTDTEGKQRRARVRNISKSSEKNTIFHEHPVYNKKFGVSCYLFFLYIGQIVSFPGVAAHRDVILTGMYSQLPFDSIYSYTSFLLDCLWFSLFGWEERQCFKVNCHLFMVGAQYDLMRCCMFYRHM